MKIGDREIGPGHEPYVIAEIGVNHDGSVDRALDLTDACAAAGADAVKFQCFEAELLMSRGARLAEYQAGAGETDPIAMLKRLELSMDQLRRCVQRAHDRGIHAIVTVFSLPLVAPASALGWDAYKSASPDIVHRPLLEAVAAIGKPMIVSTGAADMAEIRRAVGWLGVTRGRLGLLQCVSSYPTPMAMAELGGIIALREAFAANPHGEPLDSTSGPNDAINPINSDSPNSAKSVNIVSHPVIGYSDHTAETITAAVACAMGANILEKHVTHDRNAKGPDHSASLTPDDLKRYVAEARRGGRMFATGRIDADVQALLPKGPSVKRVLPIERDVRSASRQSIVAARRIKAAEVIEMADVAFMRPGGGMEPWRVGEVVGRRAGEELGIGERLENLV